MPTYSDDISKVRASRNRQAQLNAEATGLEAKSQTFGDEVWSKIREARAGRGMSDIAQSIGTTTGQLVSDPQRIYDFAGADVRPSTVDRYTASARASNLSTLAAENAYQAEIGQTLQEGVDAGTNRIIAQAAMKKAEADKAQQEADSMIEEIRLRMDQAKSAVGSKTYSYTLPNGQVLEGLTAPQYEELYSKYEGGGLAKVELKGGQQDDMNFFKDIYKAANTAQTNRSDKYTGLLDYMKGTARGAKGTQTQAESAYRSAVDAHNTAIRNKISGTAVSKSEEKQLKNMLIKPSDSDKVVSNKLNNAKNYSLSGAGSILSTAGYNELNPEEYFMQDYQIGKGTRPPISSFDK